MFQGYCKLLFVFLAFLIIAAALVQFFVSALELCKVQLVAQLIYYLYCIAAIVLQFAKHPHSGWGWQGDVEHSLYRFCSTSQNGKMTTAS